MVSFASFARLRFCSLLLLLGSLIASSLSFSNAKHAHMFFCCPEQLCCNQRRVSKKVMHDWEAWSGPVYGANSTGAVMAGCQRTSTLQHVHLCTLWAQSGFVLPVLTHRLADWQLLITGSMTSMHTGLNLIFQWSNKEVLGFLAKSEGKASHLALIHSNDLSVLNFYSHTMFVQITTADNWTPLRCHHHNPPYPCRIMRPLPYSMSDVIPNCIHKKPRYRP